METVSETNKKERNKTIKENNRNVRNIICEKEEARYILLARNFLFLRSTSFALYREEDRVEDEGSENQKTCGLFFLFRSLSKDPISINPFQKAHLFDFLRRGETT